MSDSLQYNEIDLEVLSLPEEPNAPRTSIRREEDQVAHFCTEHVGLTTRINMVLMGVGVNVLIILALFGYLLSSDRNVTSLIVKVGTLEAAQERTSAQLQNYSVVVAAQQDIARRVQNLEATITR